MKCPMISPSHPHQIPLKAPLKPHKNRKAPHYPEQRGVSSSSPGRGANQNGGVQICVYIYICIVYSIYKYTVDSVYVLSYAYTTWFQ